MAESSSDSDTSHRNRIRGRGPLKATHIRPRTNGSAEITKKIDTLAHTLQDTSQNLRNVDQMLGKYREYTGEQVDSMAALRENLEQSVDQLRSQRLRRNLGARSSSLSTLHTSDLDGETSAETHRHFPTSPLRDYGHSLDTRRRRSRSATVRFIDELDPPDQFHSLHQSLRDLSNDQLRLGEDLNTEITRRNRSEIETRTALKELSSRMAETQRQETVTDRVERRLQEIEKEMRTERQLVERRQDFSGQISAQLQEALRKRDSASTDMEDIMKTRLLKAESEKNLVEQELGRTRRRLDQSEGGRDALHYQIDELRSQLLKSEKDRIHLQQQMSQATLEHQGRREEGQEERKTRAASERAELEKQDLEKQILELKAQMRCSAALSEVEELRRTIEQKDREKAQLATHIEVLASDLEKREDQQLKMLTKLKEIQSSYENCESDRQRVELHIEELMTELKESGKEANRYLTQMKQAEQAKLECEKKMENFKVKAQDSIRHWKNKYRKVELDLEKQKEATDQLMERSNQMVKEKDDMNNKLLSTLHQMEILRKELSDIISKRAQQEEIIHQKDMELNETKGQQLGLEREVRDVREAAKRLETEMQKDNLLHTQLQDENHRLEEEILVISQRYEKAKSALHEMQGVIKNLSAIRADLTNKLAEEERSKKELQYNFADLLSKHESTQGEITSVNRQLKIEREAHQREVADLKLEIQNLKTKQERSIQEMLRNFKKEKEELENSNRTIKAEQADDRNLVKSQHRQLEKMKIECDKLSEALTRSEEENTKLKRKCLLIKQELEDKSDQVSSSDDHMRRMEETVLKLKDQVSRLETEQDSILHMIGKEVEGACEILSRDSAEKFKALSFSAGLSRDPHRWLAEIKTKLQWLCQEVKEREGKERKLRRQLVQSKEQLKNLTLNKDSESQLFIEQITKQEQLLEGIHKEKRELLEKVRRQDEEMRALQDRIVDLETSTRVALDHLESVPEKLSLLEDFRDLEESQRQRGMIEERYAKYKEIVGSLQQQLEDSKRRIQEYKDEKMDASARSFRLANFSSSLRGQNSFFSSSLLSDAGYADREKRMNFTLNGEETDSTNQAL
ncbi:centrosomal protein of 128 kDa [Protopterus annectens]|uniref:centrosomal protein of 128 kDa n=1 Tax=Protopterus annectens TaxID=7888 RepID=UPI001CFA2DA7|nr:centrosomal protein of 128 kDa [Protopterus annectens]